VRQVLLVCNALYFSKVYQEVFVPRHNWRVRVDFWLRRWLVRRSAARCDVVMTPTQALLDDMRPEVKVGKALVNPYGIAEGNSSPQRVEGTTPAPSGECGSPVRLVYVSLYAEHKNLATLLEAIRLLNRDGGRRFLLKTTVNPTWKDADWTTTYRDDLALAGQAGIAPWVEFVGPLDRAEALRLYCGADIFVFPSLVESFGHPLAEAMAAGLPIAAADTPVNREVCGPAAEYFEPFSAEDLASKVSRLATDRALRQRLGAAGCRRAATAPGWNDHVRRVLEVAEVADSRGAACRTLLVRSRDKNEQGTASRTPLGSVAR